MKYPKTRERGDNAEEGRLADCREGKAGKEAPAHPARQPVQEPELIFDVRHGIVPVIVINVDYRTQSHTTKFTATVRLHTQEEIARPKSAIN